MRAVTKIAAALALSSAWAAGAMAANPMLAEVEIKAASRAERDAGVWGDGQYIGHVRQLRGKSRLTLLPGTHELVFKLAGYEDVRRTITLEPGERYAYRLAMTTPTELKFPQANETAQVVLSVAPKDAAVFIEDRYAGHVERFAKGLRLKAGTYRIKIALPGYQPFESEMTLRPGQRYEIKTQLAKGSIAEQDGELLVVDR